MLASAHADTPQVITLDVLGKPFLTTDDNGIIEGEPQLYSVRNKLDITGNIQTVNDAKKREMTNFYYDMAGRLLKTYNIDSNTRINIPDAADKPIRSSDSRGHIVTMQYDDLQRPEKTQLHFKTSAGLLNVLVINRTEYGTNPLLNNNGLPHKQYDQSGISTIEKYDFKGNPLQTLKEFADDYENYIDWNENVELHINTFTNSFVYDALNTETGQLQHTHTMIIILD